MKQENFSLSVSSVLYPCGTTCMSSEVQKCTGTKDSTVRLGSNGYSTVLYSRLLYNTSGICASRFIGIMTGKL